MCVKKPFNDAFEEEGRKPYKKMFFTVKNTENHVILYKNLYIRVNECIYSNRYICIYIDY